jgi:cyclopropane fatty-acyl-phospholipid synthase-like methyltransferase
LNRTELPDAPSCARNRDPILEVLAGHFADRSRVLEIGSGTGQHAVHFAANLPQLTWQTSDREEYLDGIRGWLADAMLANTPPPLRLDVEGEWPTATFDAVFTANTLHIMSWPQVERTFAMLPTIAGDDAKLVVYGPFNENGRFTSDSNAAFQDWLKERGEHMGIRDIEAVDALANKAGFTRIEDRPMPANNRIVVWQRRA